MATVSLCMIVKNEEDVLARCLTSTKGLFEETIIVDTGSSDRTKEIARQFTSLVYDFQWNDDFSAARNASFSYASMDYCMWLDADDIILPEDYEKFLEMKQTLDPQTDCVMMLYHTAFDSQGKPSYSYYRERLLKNDGRFVWKGAVHEAIAPAGEILYTDIAVAHKKLHPSDPDRNLNIYQKQIESGKTLAPRDLFYYARELYYHCRYLEAVPIFTELAYGKSGWLENKIEACRLLALCYDRLQSPDSAIAALLQSFALDAPRAEACCDLGRHFLEKEQYRQAIFWYELALTIPKQEQTGAFISPDCYGYLPCIQLCVCYDRLGEHEKAREYNRRAGEFQPDSPAYLANERYFSSIVFEK